MTFYKSKLYIQLSPIMCIINQFEIDFLHLCCTFALETPREIEICINSMPMLTSYLFKANEIFTIFFKVIWEEEEKMKKLCIKRL